MRPFGALVFGRVGDLVGRKYTFLITIVIMGLSTFFVGLLPSYGSIGIAAPVILILLRMLQGGRVGGYALLMVIGVLLFLGYYLRVTGVTPFSTLQQLWR